MDTTFIVDTVKVVTSTGPITEDLLFLIVLSAFFAFVFYIGNREK